MEKIIIAYFIVIKFIGFLLCYSDKRKAQKRKWRIPEKTIFFVALLGAGIGIWSGMYLFHHKTRHWMFVIGIPMITIVEYGLLIYFGLK